MPELTLFNIPLFYYFVVLAFIMPRIPVVGRFFNIINTAIHEFGHAITALILQGKVHRIELFGDSAGSTTTQNKGKFRTFLVAISGYPFASVVAYLAFYLLWADYDKLLIVALSVLFFVMLVFWIRNKYGIVWVICFCLLNAGLIYWNNMLAIRVAALFYSTMILTESVCSTIVLLRLSLVDPGRAGDAANLKKITRIPAFIWALVFCLFSCFVAVKIYIDFL